MRKPQEQMHTHTHCHSFFTLFAVNLWKSSYSMGNICFNYQLSFDLRDLVYLTKLESEESLILLKKCMKTIHGSLHLYADCAFLHRHAKALQTQLDSTWLWFFVCHMSLPASLMNCSRSGSTMFGSVLEGSPSVTFLSGCQAARLKPSRAMPSLFKFNATLSRRARLDWGWAVMTWLVSKRCQRVVESCGNLHGKQKWAAEMLLIQQVWIVGICRTLALGSHESPEPWNKRNDHRVDDGLGGSRQKPVYEVSGVFWSSLIIVAVLS